MNALLSSTFAPAPKMLIGISALLLMVAMVLGLLNIVKIKTLRSSIADVAAARDNTEQQSAIQEKEIKARQATVATEKVKLTQRESATANADAQLAKMENEKGRSASQTPGQRIRNRSPAKAA